MDINNPLHLPEDYMKGIGSATAVLSAYEYLLETLIWKMLSLGEGDLRCEAITTNMSFSQKIHAIGTLTEAINSYKEFNRLTNKKIKKVISDANSISKKRNKIIHGLWQTDTESDTYLSSLTAYGKFKYSEGYKTIGELNKFIEKVHKSAGHLWALTFHIEAALNPLSL